MTTTLLQVLQSIPQIPETIEASQICPVLTVDASKLTETVVVLSQALAQQHSFLVMLEKENARRKTEMEFKLSDFQQDFEGRLGDESRKRHREIEALKAEVTKLRESQNEVARDLRLDIQRVGEDASRSIEKASATLKLTIMQLGDRVSQMSNDISDLRSVLDSSTNLAAKLQGKLESSQMSNSQDFKIMCQFIGVDPNRVRDILRQHTELDAWKQTPQIQSVITRIDASDESIETTKRDTSKCQGALSELTHRTAAIEGKIAGLLSDLSNQQSADLKSLIAAEIAKLARRFDDLDRRITATFNEFGGPSSIKDLSSRIDKVSAEIAEISRRLKNVQGLDQKADLQYVDVRWRALQGLLEKLEKELSALRDSVETSASKGHDSDAGSSLEALQSQLADLLARIEELEASKISSNVNKDELLDYLKDATGKLEKMIGHVRDHLQRQIGEQLTSREADAQGTAGRFRCLSCNRTAGPLHDTVKEKLSSEQFPPNVRVRSERDRTPPRQHSNVRRTPGPGVEVKAREMTSSRKKLLNYYEWLHSRSDSQPPVAPATGYQDPLDAPRSTSPPKHVWAGSQPTGGFYGERQCGSHGVQSDAIGADGKFYEGVEETPRRTSSPMPHGTDVPQVGRLNAVQTTSLRPKSAPLRRE